MISRNRANLPKLRGPVLGFVDGIMNALALASGSILGANRSVTLPLTLRISLFAAATGCFVLFVSSYVDLRVELVRSARELNLAGDGRLALTHLGRTILREAGWEAVAGAATSFIGCLVPLAVAWLIPAHGWIGILVAFVMLAALGIALAETTQGHKAVWSILLVLGGVGLTAVGLVLKIS